MGLKQLLLFVVLIGLAGAGGYGGALAVIGTGDAATPRSDNGSSQLSVLAAGQFSIPLFKNNRVAGVLLAQINLEARDFQQLQILSRQKPQLRSAIIESFFAMEREGMLSPETLDPAIVSARLKTDLELMVDNGEIGGVLIDRLLIQESGRAAPQPGLRL